MTNILSTSDIDIKKLSSVIPLSFHFHTNKYIKKGNQEKFSFLFTLSLLFFKLCLRKFFVILLKNSQKKTKMYFIHDEVQFQYKAEQKQSQEKKNIFKMPWRCFPVMEAEQMRNKIMYNRRRTMMKKKNINLKYLSLFYKSFWSCSWSHHSFSVFSFKTIRNVMWPTFFS